MVKYRYNPNSKPSKKSEWRKFSLVKIEPSIGNMPDRKENPFKAKKVKK